LGSNGLALPENIKTSGGDTRNANHVLTGTINDKNTTFVTKTEQQHGHFVASWEARDKELVSAVPMDRLVPVFPIYSGPSLEEHLDVELE